MTKDELIRQIRQAQSRGKRARYAPAVRAAVIEFARERRAAGVNWRDISQDLGIVESLVQRWIGVQRSRLVPVKLVAPGATASSSAAMIIVHGPRGIRVEGLSLGELAELFTRLSA
jgi:hypothetical protein